MFPRKVFLCNFLAVGLLCSNDPSQAMERAKNNGDIYVVNETKFMADKTTTQRPIVTTTANDLIDFDTVLSQCNASFSIPIDYLITFNTTGELPDVLDKTGMCYLRCFFEKAGLIDNWKLNAVKIRQNFWPATGDTLDFCQQQGKSEINACVRTYAIAKCLMIRDIVDARNQPTV